MHILFWPRVCSMSDSAENHLFFYFVEFLPRLQNVQISLLTSNQKLSLTNSLITSKDVKKGQLSECNLGPYSLDLTSHSQSEIGLVDGILNLRFKSDSPAQSIAPPCDILEGYEIEPSAVVLKCAFCGSSITQQQKGFKRVLPLPSESWEEFGGSAFCHYHDDDEKDVSITSPSSTKLTPRDGDCLSSSSVLLITDSSVDWEHVCQDPTTKKIHCKRCLHFLGSPKSRKENLKTSVPYSLQRSHIRVELISPGILRPLSHINWLENHFASRLYSHSQSKMMFQFSVRDPNGQHHLHIWMLNVCCFLMCNSSPAGVFNTFADIELEKERYTKALKLLFKFILADGETKNSGDSPDNDLVLATADCLKLKLLLAENNRSLPSMQREASGHQVGYLCYCSAHTEPEQ